MDGGGERKGAKIASIDPIRLTSTKMEQKLSYLSFLL